MVSVSANFTDFFAFPRCSSRPLGYACGMTITTPEGLAIPDRSFDGYIFDNDGTLALSMTLHFEAWVYAYKNNGARFTFTRGYAQSLAGVCMLETVRRVNAEFGERLDPKKVVADQETYYRKHLHRVIPNRPVVDFAKRVARTHPVAVASGGVWETVTGTLEAIGLRDLFQAIVTQDQVARSKPAPDLFLEAARRMEVAPERCLVIEDGELGILAAKEAGMEAVLIQGG